MNRTLVFINLVLKHSWNSFHNRNTTCLHFKVEFCSLWMALNGSLGSCIKKSDYLCMLNKYLSLRHLLSLHCTIVQWKIQAFVCFSANLNIALRLKSCTVIAVEKMHISFLFAQSYNRTTVQQKESICPKL